MSQHSLEQRVLFLEACEAIRNLVGRYATAADQRNDPSLMQHIFHEHAVWCAKGFGQYEGRKNILDALAKIGQEQVVWSLHIMAQPDISIAKDSKTATARWVLWELSTLAQADQRQDHWLGGFYESQLSIDAQGVWRFDRVDLNLTLNSPYREGFNTIDVA